MEVQVLPAGVADRARLEALFELYVYDFSPMLGLDVGEDGRFAVPPSVASYWSEPRKHPFLIRVSGKLAGFALVHEGSRLSGDASVRDMSEFLVLRRYRRLGVGEKAARALFDRFRGSWEVRERRENDGGIAFWRCAIGRYTGGRFEETVYDDERWRGPVQRFDAG